MSTRLRETTVALCALALASTLSPGAPRAQAQDVPPGHPPIAAPAPVEVPPGHPPVEVPAGHPPIAGEAEHGPDDGHGHGAPHGPDDGHGHGAAPGGHGHGEPMDATMERAFREPRVANADPNPSLPAGQIRVTVIDEGGLPVADQEIQLGVMRQGGDRERTPGRTDARGVFVYTELPTGSGQAYRVNVPRDGATYSSTPFQLPTEIGYDVRVQTQPTVRSDRSLLLVLGQTMIELREERLHIIQQARLSNLGAATYVFPEGGTRIPLPEGYTAFQSQAVMTDQRVTELVGQGLRIEGSLPTGQVTLAWAFDLPVTGSEMDIEIPNPFRTFQYRVLTTAPRGLSMEVEGMPSPMRFDDQGQPLLGTEVQRSPNEAPLDRIHVRLSHIPGPSPARLYAVGIALLFALGAIGFLARKPRSDGGRASRAARRQQLIEEAAGLEREHAAGEVGPQTRQSKRDAIVQELAVLLYLDDRLGGAEPAGAGAAGAGVAGSVGAAAAGSTGAAKKKKKAPSRNDGA